MHKPDRKILVFDGSPGGLYYHDVKHHHVTASNNTDVQSTALVQLFEHNKRMYTKRLVKGADVPRRTYAMVGRPSNHNFKTMIKTNVIQNFPVTTDDMRNAQQFTDQPYTK